MSTHISGLALASTDPRTDDELCTELQAAAKAWLLANRAREVGAGIHQQALAARFGYAHAKTPAEVAAEWHEDAAKATGSTHGEAKVFLYADADGTRYLAFRGPSAFFVQARDAGAFGTDFSYHDSTDSQLQEMTHEQWKGRLGTWDRLIPSGRFDRDGRAVTATVTEADPLVPDFTDTEEIAEARAYAVADHLIDAPVDMDRMMAEFLVRTRTARRVVDSHGHLFGQPSTGDPAGGLDQAGVFVLREATAKAYAEAKAGD